MIIKEGHESGLLAKYVPPLMDGFVFVGNTADKDPKESIKSYGHPEEIIAVSFFPDKLDGGELDQYRIRWALYRKNHSAN